MAGKHPPKTFVSSRLDLKIIHPRGASWWHLTLARYPDPLGYGKTPSRFSDPRVALPEEERFGVFYLGASIRVCFLETILRDRRTARTGYLPIPQSELQEWNTVPVGGCRAPATSRPHGRRAHPHGCPNRCRTGVTPPFGTGLVIGVVAPETTAAGYEKLP
jgi:hypothetical protein